MCTMAGRRKLIEKKQKPRWSHRLHDKHSISWLQATSAVCQILLFLLSLFPGSSYASAQGIPDFRLSMDSLNLRTGVSTSLTLTLENANGAKLLRIDGLDDFDLVSQSTSSSTSISGSNIHRQEDLHYTIIPKASGQYSLTA